MDRCLIASSVTGMFVILVGALLVILSQYFQQDSKIASDELNSTSSTSSLSINDVSIMCYYKSNSREKKVSGLTRRKKNSTSKDIIFEAMLSSIVAMQQDGIIQGWQLNKKVLEKDKSNYKMTEDGVFTMKDKGIYIIHSHISFWGRCQVHSYELIMVENNSHITIQNCTIISLMYFMNPDIVPCSINAEVNVRNKEKFYFKVTSNNSMPIMAPYHSYVEIIKKK